MSDGLLLVNKPAGITSFDCIRRLRRSTGVRKIGHTGTLDPAASGLMLMLFGSACKQAQQFSKLDKIYLANITLGATSSTGDGEGEIVRQYTGSEPTLERVQDVLNSFVGQITQTPPAYSAIKINGQEAYKRTRRGEKVEMPSRQVRVYEIKLLNYQYPCLDIEATVSSGTYIRTLAKDIGEELGTGAYLSGLVRTNVGQFSLDEAASLKNLSLAVVQEKLRVV